MKLSLKELAAGGDGTVPVFEILRNIKNILSNFILLGRSMLYGVFNEIMISLVYILNCYHDKD